MTNGSDGFGDSDVGKVAAVRERSSADSCYGVGDVDACQAAASRERIFVDCSNGVGDGSIHAT